MCFDFPITDHVLGVLYASTLASDEKGFELLQKAVESLLSVVQVTPPPRMLWSVRYLQQPCSGTEIIPSGIDNVLRFSPSSMDLAFDDQVLENVKEVWQRIAGEDAGEFLVFQDREDYTEDE